MNSTTISKTEIEIERRQRGVDPGSRQQERLDFESPDRQRWGGVVSFTSNNDVHAWKSVQGGNVDYRGLLPAQNDLRLPISPPDFLSQAQGEWV